MKRILPKDTSITTFFLHKDRAFGLTTLPDGRYLLKIVHTWYDTGEVMNFGYDHGEGTTFGLNPLYIIKIYDKKVKASTRARHIREFLKRYTRNLITAAAPGGN